MPEWTHVLLALATLLVGVVAGFLFAFAVVVMPGIRRLPDRDCLRAFREMDGVIQRGQPLFGLVWVGSVLAVAAALAVGLGPLATTERLLLLVAGGLYLIGVQMPTMAVNVPLNNEVQALDLDGLDDGSVAAARRRFEPRWNRWNRVRTVLAVVSTALLTALLTRA